MEASRKTHLLEENLPDVDTGAGDKPIGFGDGRVCVLFPFLDGGAVEVDRKVAKLAYWTRKNWIERSDALEMGVKFYIYCNWNKASMALPILREFGWSPRDVLFYKGDQCRPEGFVGRCYGEKISFMCDKQFSGFQWVVQMDCDQFLGYQGSDWPGDLIGFFRRLMEHKGDEIGSVYVCETAIELKHRFWHEFLYAGVGEAHDTKYQWQFLDIISTLVDWEAVCRYKRGEAVPHNNGGLYAFPARSFWLSHKGRIDWLSRAMRLLANDEAIMSLYRSRYSGGVFGVDKWVGLPFYTVHESVGFPKGDAYHSVMPDGFKGKFLYHAMMIGDDLGLFQKTVGMV